MMSTPACQYFWSLKDSDVELPSAEGEESSVSLPDVDQSEEYLDSQDWALDDDESDVSLPELDDESDVNSPWLAIPSSLDGTIRDDIMEIFSAPRLVPVVQRLGLSLRAEVSIDIETGYDLRKPAAQGKVWNLLRSRRPRFLVISPMY